MGLSCCFSLLALVAAESTQAVFNQALSAMAAGQYDASERGFRAVLAAEPGNVGALGNLGVIYSRTHRYAQAADVYTRALRLAPGDPALQTNLGLAYVKQEQYSRALPLFEKLAANPRNLQARELLATCRLGLGRNEAALAVLEPLRDSEPDNPGVLYMLGVALTRLKRIDEAHGAFTRMMEKVSPEQANFLMGKASYETGEFQQAADFLRKALQDNPGFEDAHRELGKTLISLRDHDGAEKELRKTAPDDAEALYYLGAVLAQTRGAEAIEPLRKALELNPDSWGALYYLGRVRLEQGRVNEAVSDLERAAKLNPDQAAIQYQLGRALRKAGREAEARIAMARLKELKTKSLQSEIDILSVPAAR